jgi:hypothetical protein
MASNERAPDRQCNPRRSIGFATNATLVGCGCGFAIDE